MAPLAVACMSSNALKTTVDWETLSKHETPEWVKDAKFGVYTHWGIYSIPAHAGPDYEQQMYSGATDFKGGYSHHVKTWGDVKDFGYTDFIPMFKAEKFDAAEWVGLMDEAGARLGGICLVHHDGFLLWDSKVNRWNAANMGPKKDIYGEIVAEVRKRPHMKLAATFHHGRTPGWAGKMGPKDKQDWPEGWEQWDLFDPEKADFFWPGDEASNKEFSRQWSARLKRS